MANLWKPLLNQVLQAESTEQLGASNYERSQERSDYRNGVRTRTLTTRIGKIELQVPRHRNVPFKTSLFENYQRNEQAFNYNNDGNGCARRINQKYQKK